VPRTIAHRGASAEAPENTLAAIRRAIADGADFVEVDVRLTRDGALVLMHDETLVRTTDVAACHPLRSPWRTRDLRLDELQSLDAGGWFAPTYCGEPVPTLEQAIELVDRAGVGLLVELKTSGNSASEAGALVDVLRSRRGYLDRALSSDRLVVQSFDWDAMGEHRTAAPDIPVGLLGRPQVAQLPELSQWADFVNPNHLKIDRSYVDRVRSTGMQCWVWTVDHPVLIGRATRIGVDGIITNHPHRANHIRERGIWNDKPARPAHVGRPSWRKHPGHPPAMPV
jgi:glycerophosphoryl diester phosphodiesterase